MHSPTTFLVTFTGLLTILSLSLAQLHHSNPLLAHLNLIERRKGHPNTTSIITTTNNNNNNTITATITTIITTTTATAAAVINRDDDDKNKDKGKNTDGNACSSSYASLIDSIPTPTNQSALLAALTPFLATADAADPTIYCAVVTQIPDRQLRHNYQLWNAAMEDWCEDHGKALEGLARDCVVASGSGGGDGEGEGAEDGYVDAACTGTQPITLTSLERSDVMAAPTGA
ncbi:hypothetical protein UCREL1_4427 [Eutypa lata UCREL1]|uniref:Uncharacterized protein n=1 Tax=Eutypa lata (strain UCR-EL1) TaxID=1287681 RepID=M7SWB6_EUTLA|nr:hypothetical protein UCREL1_4427 [Eutypa lata UCREL1]